MCQLCPRTMTGGFSVDVCAQCHAWVCARHIEWSANAWRCKRCIRTNKKMAEKQAIARASVMK